MKIKLTTISGDGKKREPPPPKTEPSKSPEPLDQTNESE